VAAFHARRLQQRRPQWTPTERFRAGWKAGTGAATLIDAQLRDFCRATGYLSNRGRSAEWTSHFINELRLPWTGAPAAIEWC